MKEIVGKILNIDLVSKDLVENMERWGLLPEGSSDKYKEVISTKKHKEKLKEWAEDLASSLDEEHNIKETNLDLSRMRWPIKVDLVRAIPDPEKGRGIAWDLTAVRDVMGRFFFRIQDVNEKWFIPGYKLEFNHAPDGKIQEKVSETIAEKEILYMGDVPVCIQVTTIK